jgi:prepilin-type N-terminal cleavage/methylation domain-containing protein
VPKGFSIVEVLIAAALIGLAFLAISTLFPTAYGNITYGGRTTTAVAYAQQKIERLKAIAADTTPGQGFNAINTTNCSTTPETLADPLVPTITFTRTCALTTNVGTAPLAADLKKVRVTVIWAAQNRPGSIQMEALFTR